MKKALYGTLFVVFLAVIAAVFYGGKMINSDILTVAREKVDEFQEEKGRIVISPPGSQETAVRSENSPASEVKGSVLIDMPFLPQAPFQEWDALHEDACEEASLVMVKYFLDGKSSISKEQGEIEIQNMVGFEDKNGYGLSITMDQLNVIAEKFYGLKNGKVKKNITIEDIKKEVANGRPVIIGAAGKILPNPNFRNGGPNYHMLVVKGYDDKGFITNDPGTRKGEDFRYSFDDLYEAVHDWDEDDILKGGKNYLVFE